MILHEKYGKGIEEILTPLELTKKERSFLKDILNDSGLRLNFPLNKDKEEFFDIYIGTVEESVNYLEFPEHIANLVKQIREKQKEIIGSHIAIQPILEEGLVEDCVLDNQKYIERIQEIAKVLQVLQGREFKRFLDISRINKRDFERLVGAAKLHQEKKS